MVVEYTQYRIPEDQREWFVDAYERAAGYLSESPHCLAYELSHSLEDQEHYILRVEWTSAQKHLEAFRNERGFPEFLRLVQPFAGNIERMNHYELTGIVLWKKTV